ncbi:MAG: FtsB family cell division protein [Acidimicrobiales bacterium]
MRRHPWLAVALLALLGVLGLGAFPARAYLDQVNQRQDLARQVDELARANAKLDEEKARLGTDEAIERLARERYQLVRPGEEAYVILPSADTPSAAAAPAAGPAAPPKPPEQSWWNKAWSKFLSLL